MDTFLKLKNAFSKITENIFKNKKLIVFVFLFLVIIGFTIPIIASADWNPACWEWVWGKAKPNTFRGDYCHFSSEQNQDLIKSIPDPIKTTFAGVVIGILSVFLGLAGALATLAGSLLSTVMGTSANVCYTCFANPVISNGWPIMRDLANMIIVLGFVVIGVATTLRFKDYEAKKLLIPLIGAALLINFSLVICGVFIDGSNIIIKYFLHGGGFLEKNAVANVTSQTTMLWTGGWDYNEVTNKVGLAVGFIFYDLMLMLVFLMFFFLFFMRYIMLWILVMASPLAFVCYVFPMTKKFFNMWWNNFLSWCIIGAPAALFMYISDKIASNFLATASSTTVTPTSVGIEMLGYLTPCLFLIAGFIFSLKSGAIGADMITSRASKAFSTGRSALGGMATGAFGNSAKKLASISGADRLAFGAKDFATRTGERLGLVNKGTTLANRRSRLANKNISEAVAKMSDEEKARFVNYDITGGKQSAIKKAAIVKDLASKNKLGLLNDQDTAIRNAQKNGVKYSELVGGMDSSRIADALNNNRGDAETRAKGFETLMKRGSLDLIQGGTPAQTQALRTRLAGEAMTHGIRPEDAERVDYHYGSTNEARRDRIRSANEFINRDPSNSERVIPRRRATEEDINIMAQQQALDENWKKMSPEQRQNVEATADNWRHSRVDKLTTDDINGLKYANNDVKDRLRDRLGAVGAVDTFENDLDIATRIATAWGTNGRVAPIVIGTTTIPPGDANPAQVDHYTKEANRISSLMRSIRRL